MLIEAALLPRNLSSPFCDSILLQFRFRQGKKLRFRFHNNAYQLKERGQPIFSSSNFERHASHKTSFAKITWKTSPILVGARWT